MTYDTWKATNPADEWQDWEQQTDEICYCGHSGAEHSPACHACDCLAFDCEYED